MYGIDIKGPSDEYLLVAHKSMDGLAEAIVPGKYVVDFLPFLKHTPSWLPGATFAKVAAKFKPYIAAVREAPFQKAREIWVKQAFVMHT